MAIGAAAGAPAVLAGSTGVVLQLDADWATWIRAQRRAQGLDAPDPLADAQFQAMLQRLQARGSAGDGSRQQAGSEDCVASAPVAATLPPPARPTCSAPGRSD